MPLFQVSTRCMKERERVLIKFNFLVISAHNCDDELPFHEHFQTMMAMQQKSRPKTRLSADRIMALIDRNLLDRQYRIDPTCTARRRSSPSPHSYRIPIPFWKRMKRGEKEDKLLIHCFKAHNRRENVTQRKKFNLIFYLKSKDK